MSDTYTAKCDKCDREFTKGEPNAKGRAMQALHMHQSRTHGKMRGNPHAKRRKPYKARATKRQNISEAMELTSVMSLAFCPHCGCNIQRINLALKALNRIDQ